jgi:predicted solute-binding protein
VQLPGYRIEHVLKDIQELNTLAREGELEVTACRGRHPPWMMAYIMNVGSSVGRGGPIVVSAVPRKVGVFGMLAGAGAGTTVYLLARIFLPEFEPVVVLLMT